MSIRSKLLAPLAFLYGFIGTARAAAYETTVLKKSWAGVPVISVGNITVGGTGKTPIVIDLAARFTAQGRRVAILSRGYGRKSTAATLVVSQGAGPVVAVEDSGDEPYLMAQSVPEACVIVGSQRKISAELAVQKLGCDLIILDDGMQHMQLGRDVEVVLFDYNDEPARLEMLPAGRLREPIVHLSRAKIIVITKVPVLVDDGVKKRLATLSSQLGTIAPLAVLHYVSFVPDGWRQKDSATLLPLFELSGKSAVALCGIARPESFLANLALPDVDIKVLDSIAVGDHHWFTVGDLARVDSLLKSSAAQLIVTTEKDLVRLARASFDLPLWALVLSPRWLDINGVATNAFDFDTSRLVGGGVNC